uniref:Uncharacterized protein n=1 Tax=Palpitomonas bilix TaxID=652834 RepID=A0A7S3G670_9EUKA|mmetsp:Transcript_32799/g.84711  ORF Transcript_32799/g.84711 Transcript_32799/m.84711 type:complete len:226 (+) Transcript_32799:290-967(+)|eukprot:CAMPEP_0113887622 /NCGR_PEP_ID=MMETSP0780_2-20120614/12326_1 /TAXON_ID=652834 /ORGANISM="Palpitomonas bilix" /LENGTH=225 /DNA_ID=CAMNT_0000876195 /DNA_START=167 /DNA_END=844 /DNA_ORIENTATION=+ /assembly_acc=CAM_ASM_000599
MGWNIDLGPFSIGSKGASIKPQLKFGVSNSNFSAGAGIGDLRNGISGELGAEVKQSINGEGESLEGLFRDLKANGAGAVLNDLIRLVPRIVAEVIRLIGVDISKGDMKGRFTVSTGVGFSGALALGWTDTEGYNTVGAGGEVATGLNMGFSIFAGVHKSKKSVKVQIKASNFGVGIYYSRRDGKKIEVDAKDAHADLKKEKKVTGEEVEKQAPSRKQETEEGKDV